MGGEGDMAAPSLPSVGDGADESKVPADFVRKLFNMLEEPRYNNIVCWGPRKDSFIVLEQGRITKEILPNHFKHSNFASFVRQLNKYGFHKKKEDKDGGPPLHPPDVWEFSHPDFSWANRDSLDKIRRKVPASRKPQAANDDNGHAVAQVNLMAETMVATNLQIERLNELVSQLNSANAFLHKELKQLQHAHQGTQQVNQQLLTWAFAQDELKLKNRHPMHSNHSGQFGALPDGNDEPSAELKKARELLNTFGMAPMAPNGYQDVGNMPMGHFQNQGDSPPDSTTGPTQLMFTSQPMPNSAIMPSAHAMMPNTFDNLVYPTGQNNGIDPFHPDRANNLPYPLQSQSQAQNVDPVIREGPDHGNHGLWANGQTPRILLVEDDKTCSRIGSKFLSSVDCNVECAQDGEVATNKLNSDPERFDLIFMDIIMPKLDGISATIYIRTVNPHVPIIAMTSNIRAEDMATYYQWGMNDILAKPFTRDGMVKILKKYCGHMLKNPEAHAHELSPNGTAAAPFSAAPSASTPTFALSATNMKLETTPINSPATSTSWHSPGALMQQASPNLETGGYMTTHVSAGGPQMSQMVKAQAPVGSMQAPPGGGGGGGMPQQQQQQGTYGAPQLQNPNSARGHRMPDMGADEKRQRLSYSGVHAPGNVPFSRR